MRSGASAVTPLEELVVSEIRSEGPMTVARFMELALYHPQHGYYTAGPARTGWRGHFLTAPEIDPAFGQLWARGIEQIWAACDRPARFQVVEIGPGEGGFIAAVLGAVKGDLASAISFMLVERSDALRARQAARLAGFDRVSWTESVAGIGARSGCVFANEVLDNAPVHVVEAQPPGVMEVRVDAGPGGLQTKPAPPEPDVLAWLEANEIHLRPGHHAEVGLESDALMASAAAAIDRGALVMCDYGLSADELEHRPAGTIACYSETGVDDAFLDRPGAKDITSHVNWTALSNALEAAGLDIRPLMSQRTALKRLGLDAMHEELRGRIELGGIEAVRALSRRQALGVVADPGGLGRLGVLVALKGIDPPPFVHE